MASDAKLAEVQRQVEENQLTLETLRRETTQRERELQLLQDALRDAKLQLTHAERRAQEEGEAPAFPWPPPPPTSCFVIPRHLLVSDDSAATWGQVADRLQAAADRAGFPGYTWFSVPNGFALVLHLEQFDKSGHFKDPRWAAKASCSSFSVRCIVQALLTASPGRYRVVVIAVATGATTVDLETALTIEWAQSIWKKGSLTFPTAWAGNRYSAQHSCVALVYEFKQLGPQVRPEFQPTAILTAQDHLKGSGLWPALGGT